MMKSPDQYAFLPVHQEDAEIEKIPNIPSYDDMLRDSHLPRELFTEEKYKNYIESIKKRVSFLFSQIEYLDDQVQTLNPEIHQASTLFIQYFELAIKNVKDARSELNTTINQQDLFPNQDHWFLIEEKIDKVSSWIRELKFIVAGLYTIGGFQAMSIVASKERQQGIGQISQNELETEYARYDFSPNLTEEVFNDSVEIPIDSVSSTHFFSSGMAAITTALALTKDINPEGTYLFGSNLYFENQNQHYQLGVEKQLENVESFNELNPDDLENKLERDPQFIFVEPVGNTRDMPYVDIKKITDTLTSHDRRILIIDNTLCGPNFSLKDVAGELDDRTVILIVSSLQKLYQDGDDLASSGMVTVVAGNEENRREISCRLKSFRAMLGTNITPFNFKLIQKDNPELFKQHSKRIGENVAELALFLKERKYPILEKIVTSPIGKDNVSQATVFYLHFYNDVGLDFIDIVIEKARQRNLQIVDGASFGFKNTRLMVIEDVKYVRVCPGIENPREIALLKEIFEESLKELSDEIIEEDTGV